jgi:hypothetical protein
MKIIFLSLLGCIAFVPAYLNAQVQLEQQERPYKSNAVYLELGGPGLIYSLGYEATFYHNRQLSIISGFGMEYLPVPGGGGALYIQPGALYHFGKNGAIEFGLALDYIFEGKEERYTDGGSYITCIVPRLGYRCTFHENRVFFRCGLTPIMVMDDSESAAFSDKGRIIFMVNIATFGIRF